MMHDKSQTDTLRPILVLSDTGASLEVASLCPLSVPRILFALGPFRHERGKENPLSLTVTIYLTSLNVGKYMCEHVPGCVMDRDSSGRYVSMPLSSLTLVNKSARRGKAVA